MVQNPLRNSSIVRHLLPVLLLGVSACGQAELAGVGDPLLPDSSEPVSSKTSAIVQNVGGTVYVQKANGSSNFLGVGFNVKFCNDAFFGASSGGGSCFTAVTNSSGNYQVTPNALSGNYWFFTWNDSVYWGSSSQSAYATTVTLYDLPNQTVHLQSRPRPLPPQAVFPVNGATNLGTTLNFNWTDGLDADRRTPSWPVTYDVYRNVLGSPEVLVASGIPCCTHSATVNPGTSYRWRVVARMNTQVGAPGDPLYRTSSAIFGFTTAPVLAPVIRVVDSSNNGGVTPALVVDLGSTVVGVPLDRGFRIHNDGNANLLISNASGILSGASYTLPTIPASTVIPGGNTPFNVRLDATTTGTFVANISILHNDTPRNPFNFQIRGVVTPAPTPRIRVVDTSNNSTVNRGDTIPLGTFAAGSAIERTFNIHNDGGANLTISNPSSLLSGTGYTLVSPPSSLVGPSGVTSFRVRVQAASPGSFAGNVSIGNNDALNNPFSFGLSANAQYFPRLRVSDAGSTVACGGTVNLGSAAVGAAALTRNLTLHNDGQVNLNVSSQTLSGSSLFLLTPGPTTLTPGGTGPLQVSFVPSAPGSYSTQLTIASNDPQSPCRITLQALVQGPRMQLSANLCTAVNGGLCQYPNTSVNVGQPIIFTITNTGNQDLVISNPTTLLSTTGGFQQTVNPVTPVVPGGSTTFRIRLLAGTAGTYTGTVTIGSNDTLANPYQFTVRGVVGGLPTIRVVSGDGVTLTDGGTYSGFPVTVAGTPVSRAFTIYNDGTADLILSNPASFVSGADFSLIVVPATTIAAGSSTVFRVRLLSGTPGTKSGGLAIGSNAQGGTFDQTLLGTVN